MKRSRKNGRKNGAGPAKCAERVSKKMYYLNIAKEVARRSTCLRRHYGAVIVNNDQLVSTGYAGSPRKTMNCSEVGTCLRIQLGARPGEHYEWCRSVHAEQNAIIHAPRFDMIGATIYIVGVTPDNGTVIRGAAACKICKRMIINAGIEHVVTQTSPTTYREEEVSDWIKSNMGDFKRVKGRLVPVMQRGY